MFTDPNAFMDHITNGHIGPHLLENSSVGQLKCPSCPLSFDRTQLLRDHMTSVHNSMPSFSVQAQPIQLGHHQLVFPTQPHPPSSIQVKLCFRDIVSLLRVLHTGIYDSNFSNNFKSNLNLSFHMNADPKSIYMSIIQQNSMELGPNLKFCNQAPIS